MNQNLQNLFKKYTSSPSIETQRDVAKFYTNNYIDRDLIETEILEFIKNDLIKPPCPWKVFFEHNMDFWRKIYLMEIQKEADDYLLRITEHPELFSFAIDMCDIRCDNVKEIKGLPIEVEKIWVNTFKDFDFKKHLDERIKEKKDRLKKYLESLNLEPIKEKTTIKTLKIVVPITIKGLNESNILSFSEINELPEYQTFMKERVEYFNNFGLHSYIEMPQCHKISMSVDNDNNIFSLELNDLIDENKLKDELIGQLTDGLGENLSQQSLLIKDQEYIFDFDVENASEMLEVKKENKKNGIKK